MPKGYALGTKFHVLMKQHSHAEFELLSAPPDEKAVEEKPFEQEAFYPAGPCCDSSVLFVVLPLSANAFIEIEMDRQDCG
jgi:hypothetical protein